MNLTSNSVRADIEGLISELIGCGVCDDSNFPVVRTHREQVVEVSFNGAEYISGSFGERQYIDVYQLLLNERSFSMKLVDGALLQMMYIIERDKLRQHRLAFYPSPSLLPFQDDPESYMDDELFVEIVKRKIIPFPLRFDFDSRQNVYKDVIHPMSHLTLGDVKECRIPISAPLTPRWFIEFILRNFYQTKKYDFVIRLPQHNIKLSSTITNNERKLIHMVVPYSINIEK